MYDRTTDTTTQFSKNAAARRAMCHAGKGRGRQIVAAVTGPGVGKSPLFYEFKGTSPTSCADRL